MRGGYGVSYVHFHRAGGGNVLPINGPQVINAVVNQTPADAGFLPTQGGYPAGLTDPSRFVPTAANVTYMPPDNKTSSVQSWYVSVQREVLKDVVVDLAYVGNKASNLLLFANFNQARPNNPGENLSMQARRPIPEFGDITYAFNGGFSRYKSFQARVEARRGSLRFLNSLTLSKAEDNGAGTLENPNGNFPAPQDFYNLGAEGRSPPTTSPGTTPPAWSGSFPSGTGAATWDPRRASTQGVLGGWRLSVINVMWAGDPITFQYAPGAGLPGLGDHAGLPGRQQLSAEHHLRPRRGPLDHQLLQPGLRGDPHRRQPARSATRRGTPCAATRSTRWTSASPRPSACPGASRRSSCAWRRSTSSTRPTSAPRMPI